MLLRRPAATALLILVLAILLGYVLYPSLKVFQAGLVLENWRRIFASSTSANVRALINSVSISVYTVVGAGAGELLTPLTMAMTHGLTLAKNSSTIFPYPTRVEGVKRAADAFQRERLDGLGGRVLRRVVKWLS